MTTTILNGTRVNKWHRWLSSTVHRTNTLSGGDVELNWHTGMSVEKINHQQGLVRHFWLLQQQENMSLIQIKADHQGARKVFQNGPSTSAVIVHSFHRVQICVCPVDVSVG